MRLPGRREEHDRTSSGFSLARGRRPTGAAEASCPLIFGRDVVLKEGDRSDRRFPDSSHPAARAQGVSGRGGTGLHFCTRLPAVRAAWGTSGPGGSSAPQLQGPGLSLRFAVTAVGTAVVPRGRATVTPRCGNVVRPGARRLARRRWAATTRSSAV